MVMASLTSPGMGVPPKAIRPSRPIGNQQRLSHMATVRSRQATFSVQRKGLCAEMQGSTHHRAKKISSQYALFFHRWVRCTAGQPVSPTDHGQMNARQKAGYSSGNSTGVGMQLSWQSVGPALCRRRFDSPVQQRIFPPESTFSADSLTVSVHHRVQWHAFTSVGTLKVLQSMSEFGGVWKHKHPACTAGWVARLCRGQLSKPIFPWKRSYWNKKSCKKNNSYLVFRRIFSQIK